MARQHKIAGILFTALGLYVVIYSFVKLDIGSLSKPGSGFFTVICGGGIFGLSLIWLLAGLKKPVDLTPFWEKGQWLSPALAIAVTIAYVVLMKPLGYVLSTAVFIVLWQVIVSHSKPITIVVFTILGTACMYFLFEVLLSVPLPNGILSF